MSKAKLYQLQTNPPGMSFVIELSDKRFIVIDGGMYCEGERLYSFLCELCGNDSPEVDSWFFTHAHPDHTFCAVKAAELYSDKLKVKRFLYNFPSDSYMAVREGACIQETRRFKEAINVFGAETLTPHAGDRFSFSELEIEVLFTCDELPDHSQMPLLGINDSSMIMRIYCEGQSILILGDVMESANKVLMERLGNKLKSDVCQVAHHGSRASTAAFYDLIDPEILLWPCGDRAGFLRNVDVIGTDRHLIDEMRVRDHYVPLDGHLQIPLPVQVRKEPFIPQLTQYPDRELSSELVIAKANQEPDIGDPKHPSWEQAELIQIDGSVTRSENDHKAFLRLLWKDDTLYFNVRVDKKYVSDPKRSSSLNSDCVRLYITPEPVREYNKDWFDLEGLSGCYPNIKLYGEKKNCIGRLLYQSGASEDELSSGRLLEDDRYYITASVKMDGKRKKGDMIGLNVEVACVDTDNGVRTADLNLAKPHKLNMLYSPVTLAFAELG